MDEQEQEKQDLLRTVQQTGEEQKERASLISNQWKQWANKLDNLIREIPSEPKDPVYYSGVDTVRIDLGCDHISPEGMINQLKMVRADADAYASAWKRAQYLIRDYTSESLMEIDPPDPGSEEAVWSGCKCSTKAKPEIISLCCPIHPQNEQNNHTE